MAEDKNGVIVYADWIDKFEELNNEEAGKLIKHFFRYINDLNPEAPDRITKISFIDIEKSLKRDLKKWEKTLEGRSRAGKASALARANKKEQSLTLSTSVESVKQTSTNPTVSVNDNVNVTVNVNDIKKKRDAIALAFMENVNPDKKVIFDSWIQYRKEIKKSIKSQTTLISLIKKINSEPLDKCIVVINASIENQWTGLFWDKVVPKRQNTLEVAGQNAMDAAEIIRLRG